MFVLSDTHVFTPNVINVARFGFMRFNGLSRGDEPINASDVGMATPSGFPEIPGISVNGLLRSVPRANLSTSKIRTLSFGRTPFLSRGEDIVFGWAARLSVTNWTSMSRS